MPIEDLPLVISKLQERIQQFRASLGSSEARTRYALVDPLLRVLGWDTEDPNSVRIEEHGAGGIVDYALVGQDSGTRVALVEAKRLNLSLRDAVPQNLNYCNQEGVPTLVVTNGNHWEAYDVFNQSRIEERRVCEFDIESMGINETANAALYLWRPNLQRGKRVLDPTVSLAFLRDRGFDQPVRSPKPDILETKAPIQDSSLQSRFNLANLPYGRLRDSELPIRVTTPTGDILSGKDWKDLAYGVYRWLVTQRMIRAEQCPISHGKDRYLINTQPNHSQGKPFERQVRVGDLWLEGKGTTNEILHTLEDVIRKTCGSDPSKFVVG